MNRTMISFRFASCALAVAAALFFQPHPSSAQAPPLYASTPPGVLTPGRSLAGNTDATATTTNPANLGFLPAAEFRWQWVTSPNSTKLVHRGDSFDLATPLFFGFSGGLRLDLVRPADGTNVADYRWITAALAYGGGRRPALGLSVARSYSEDPRLASHWNSTVGVTWWARPWLGLAGTIRNWNKDHNATGAQFDRTYEIGAAVRPFGTRALEIGLEERYAETLDRHLPRAVLGVDIPYIGRFRGDVAMDYPFDADRRAVVATAGLELVAGFLSVNGGVVGGNGIGGNQLGNYGGISLRAYREPGLPLPRQVVRFRVEATPGTRSHVRLLRALWRLAEADDVAGVLFVLKSDPASSMAHAEELGDAFRLLRSRGKKVICHLEDGGGRALHVCSQADRTVINPAGGVRFAGLRSQYMYYGELLSKIGVRADFVRIGDHKTAPEQFTRTDPTAIADDDHRDLLRQIERIMMSDIGGGRRIPLNELRARIARGPFVAREAKEAGLVDGYAYDDELNGIVAEVVGHTLPVLDADSTPVFAKRAPDALGPRPRIALVYLDGDIIDGRSRQIPLVDIKLVGSYTVAEALKCAREDRSVRAVVFRVESPGGSSMASDVIWREVYLTAKVKPVIVSMGSTAASGGYYVAVPATKIFANRSTITGSIGVFYGKADIEELLKKVGISLTTYRTAPRADAESIYRPFTDDEHEELGRKVKTFYDTFVDRVARGRHMNPDEVDAVARGHVWTGEQAQKRRLIDTLGGLREALVEARKRGGLTEDAPILELPEVPTSLLNTVLSLTGLAETPTGSSAIITNQLSAIPVPSGLLDVARALAPFVYYDAHTPLMRLEIEPLGL